MSRSASQIRSARRYNGSASSHRPCTRYSSARLLQLVATRGWSGPKAASRIASARRYNGSAATSCPVSSRRVATLFNAVATCGCCEPCSFSASVTTFSEISRAAVKFPCRYSSAARALSRVTASDPNAWDTAPNAKAKKKVVFMPDDVAYRIPESLTGQKCNIGGGLVDTPALTRYYPPRIKRGRLAQLYKCLRARLSDLLQSHTPCCHTPLRIRLARALP